MTPPEYINPTKFVIVEGLLGYSTRGARDAYDVKVYLAPPESLRTTWKIKRDTMKRGYAPEQVKAELEKREPDSEAYIRPQRQWSDIVVTFYPPVEDAQESNGHLNVKLVLRPTIPHPDFTEIIKSNSADYTSPIRLDLDRDMGKPVDVLEVDGNATKEQVIHLERTLCNEVPHLMPFCNRESNPDIGKLIGTTGETLESYPLALTQLLISYHMLKAANIHRM